MLDPNLDGQSDRIILEMMESAADLVRHGLLDQEKCILRCLADSWNEYCKLDHRSESDTTDFNNDPDFWNQP
jgi:hypothetical protein